jgi:glycosyltransferase involved in cell wall biosynthesis
MRIAVVTSLFPSSVKPHEGIFALRRWAGMRRRGHDVRVVQPLPWAPPVGRAQWRQMRAIAAHESLEGVEVRRPRYLHLPGRALGNARRFARCAERELAQGAPFEVLVADYAWPAAMLAQLCARRAWPFVVNGRGSDVLQVAEIPQLRAELAAALRLSKGWCAVSEHLVRAMDELAGEPRGVLVANGVDAELFAPRERRAARAALGLSGERAPDAPLVLVVGHLIERKDPLLALEVVARLRASAAANARLVYVGRGVLESELRAAVASRGFETWVSLVGEAAPDVLARWYNAADALLLTSRREGRPNVVLEALSSGLPVLATDAGGTAELLAGDARMLARTREPQELAAQLAGLLSAPRDSQALRALAQRWSWEGAFAALDKLLERARGAANGAPR